MTRRGEEGERGRERKETKDGENWQQLKKRGRLVGEHCIDTTMIEH